jgi:signal transduction histidine kinase
MAKKAKAKGKAKKAKARKAPKRKVSRKAGVPTAEMFDKGMHDFTNLATALRAYLELLASQGNLDEKQKYYIARSREQVEMLIDLVRELKEKL